MKKEQVVAKNVYTHASIVKVVHQLVQVNIKITIFIYNIKVAHPPPTEFNFHTQLCQLGAGDYENDIHFVSRRIP